jgi:5-dehydro-4-deoxyglucarate dehydratase
MPMEGTTLRPSEFRDTLRGIVSFAPSPFDDDDRVDLDGLAALVDRLAGVGGPVAVCGAIAEYPALDLDEYRAVIDAASQTLAGRAPLIVGIGHGTRIATGLAEHAARAGAAGLLIDPFWFAEPDDDGVAAHFEAIARASGLGLVCFSTVGQAYPLERLLRLAEVDGVVALKDELGDLDLFVDARRRIGSRWAWVSGMAELHASRYLAAGADAFTSGLVNVAPDLARAVWDAASSGDHARAAALADVIRPFAELRARRPGYSVAVLKEAIAMLGGPGGGRVRPPLSRVRPDDREELRVLLPSLAAAAAA